MYRLAADYYSHSLTLTHLFKLTIILILMKILKNFKFCIFQDDCNVFITKSVLMMFVLVFLIFILCNF